MNILTRNPLIGNISGLHYTFLNASSYDNREIKHEQATRCL